MIGAFCDEDLLEKELEDERFKIKVSRNFYGGMLVSEKVATRMMKRLTIGNLIGKNTVDAAVRSGFITEENIIQIDGVPHAQFVKF